MLRSLCQATVPSASQTGRADPEMCEHEGRAAPWGPSRLLRRLTKYRGVCCILKWVHGWLLNPRCHVRHHDTQGKKGKRRVTQTGTCAHS